MEIVKEPNQILRKKLAFVNEINDSIRDLISAMRQKMVEANGVGLAANQVGENLSIFVVDAKLAEENNVPDAYINPEIIEYSKDRQEMEEGCLSLPDFWKKVRRPKKIRIKALDENGKKIKIKAKGFLARVLQHEYDHLRGILIKEK